MSQFLVNANTVPLTDLVTLNLVVVVALALIAKYYEYSWQAVAILFVILLLVDIFIHPAMGIPNNVSYYFGQGPKPVGWRG